MTKRTHKEQALDAITQIYELTHSCYLNFDSTETGQLESLYGCHIKRAATIARNMLGHPSFEPQLYSKLARHLDKILTLHDAFFTNIDAHTRNSIKCSYVAEVHFVASFAIEDLGGE